MEKEKLICSTPDSVLCYWKSRELGISTVEPSRAPLAFPKISDDFYDNVNYFGNGSEEGKH